MEKVLNITARLEDKRRKEQIEAYRDRFDAVQRVLQCSACEFKCAMCNRHIERPNAPDPIRSAPSEFVLCDSCRTEFDAYQKMSERKPHEPEVFWHNAEWMNLWACWVDFQRAIRSFRNSFDLNKTAQLEENSH